MKLNCYFSVSRKIRIATICNFAPKSSTCAPCALPRWRWIKIKSKQKSRENIGCHNLFTMRNFVVWRCCPKEIVILWNCNTLRTFDNSVFFCRYFDSGWNIFDLVIVVASLVDIFAENLNGISVLRGMRLVSTKTQKKTLLFFPTCYFLEHDIFWHRGGKWSKGKGYINLLKSNGGHFLHHFFYELIYLSTQGLLKVTASLWLSQRKSWKKKS